MMSFSQVKSAGNAGAYYTAKDNYYVLGSMDAQWAGKGAQALGLEGPVDKDTFTQVLEGRLPDGSDLTRMQEGVNRHRPGYDFTFSAPKSVSMMALACGDDRLLEAHNRAVTVALTELERMASTRVMEDGVSRTVLTGSLVIARFNHDTSREQEPQLHTHAVTANATLHDGRWQTLATDTVGKTGFVENVLAVQTALGRLYRETLRADVESLGYRTEETGNKHGMWEMTGVPVGLFSGRHRQINEAVGEDASLKSRDVAALDTRESKKYLDPVEAVARWQAVMKEAGFDSRAYREQAGTRAQEQDGPPVAAAPGPGVDRAVGDAIALLSERSVQFSYSQVLSRTLNLLPAQPEMVTLAREGIARAIEGQRLIPLDREKGVFTSTLHVVDELSVNALGREILGRGPAVLLPARGTARTAPYSDAVSVLAQDRAGLAVLSGRGGAAVQRDRMAELVTMSREQGRDVQILAADERARHALRADARFGDVTVTGKMALQPSQGGAERPSLVLTPSSTLIVDQGEKLTLKEAERLLAEAVRHHVQVLVMDTQARSGTGSVPDVLQDAGVNRYRYQGGQQVAATVVSEPDKGRRMARLAADYARAAKAGEAVTAQVSGGREQAALAGHIREALVQEGVLRGPEVTVTALTPVWMNAVEKKSTDSWRPGMVLEKWNTEEKTRTRWQVSQVGAQTRSLVLTGALGQQETVKMSALDGSWSAYRVQRLQVAEGDSLRVLARQADTPLRAGDRVTVTGVAAGRIEVAAARGGVVSLAGTDSAFTAPALTQGYVESPGASVSDEARVLVALTAREMNARTLNQVARSGCQVELHTALPPESAAAKLARLPVFSLVTATVRDAAGEQDLSLAMRAQRDRLYSPVQQALHLAVPVLENQDIALRRPALIAQAMGMAEGERRLSVAEVEREIGAMVRRGDLMAVKVSEGQGVDLLVSRRSWEAEKSILQHVLEGKDAVPPLLSRVPEAALAGLTPGQRASAGMMLETRDRFTLVQGYAGVGKTTQFRAVMAALTTVPEAARPTVQGLGPTHRAVGEMQAAGVQAQTLSRFLHDAQEQIRAGEKPDFSRTLFLMDESSMTGNTDMAAAYALIAAGGGRAVSVGDSDQLQSISAGAPFRLQQQRSSIDMAVMKDIVRQVPALRPAVYRLIDRDVRGALAVIESVRPEQVPRREGAWVPARSVLELKPEPEQKTGHPETPPAGASPSPLLMPGGERPADPVSAIVADWLGRTDEARAQTLVITHLNADRRAVNSMIHTERRTAGELPGREVEIPVLTTANIREGELRSLNVWGAHPQAVVRLDERYWQIAGVDKAAGLVTLHGRDGDERILSPAQAVREKATLYHPETITVSAGDRMRFSRTDNERGYVANQVVTVSDIRDDGRLVLHDGKREVVVDPLRDETWRHVDLAYALTTHGAQGASEPFAIALEGVAGGRQRMTSQESAYVALSRSKQHVQVYTDDRTGWENAASVSEKRPTAHDILSPRNDRDIRTAARLMSTARPLADVAQGRDILRVTGLRGDTRGKFIGGGKTFPQAHVAFPAYDRNGREAGIWLSPVGRNNLPAVEGRIKGSPEAQFIALQQSRDGRTVLADGLRVGMVEAARRPDTGIIVRLHGEGTPWNPGAITGGRVWENAARGAAREAPDRPAEVPFPQAAEEKRLRELAAAAERVAQEQAEGTGKTGRIPGVPDPDGLIAARIRDVVTGPGGEKRPENVPLPDSVTGRDREEAVRRVAEQASAPQTRGRQQQTEREFVPERARPLVPGGD